MLLLYLLTSTLEGAKLNFTNIALWTLKLQILMLCCCFYTLNYCLLRKIYINIEILPHSSEDY